MNVLRALLYTEFYWYRWCTLFRTG